MFVPDDGVLEGLQGKLTLVEKFLGAVDAQVDGHALGAGEALADVAELAGHQGEEIGGFRVRVMPFGEMAAVAQIALAEQVAVGQADPEGAFDAHPEGGEHVGPVAGEGNAAEALGLALGAVDAAGAVEAGEGAVFLGVDTHQRFQLGAFRQVGQGQ